MQINKKNTNCGIEFHDSYIDTIRQESSAILLDLRVFVHRTHGIPGIDRGTVWKQDATISLLNGRLLSPPIESISPEFFIYDGSVTTEGLTHKNVIECPFDSISLSLIEILFCSGDELRIEADRITIAFTSEPEYLYEFER